MDTPTENLKSLFADAGEYMKMKSELWKLKLIDKTSDIVSSVIEKVILAFLGFMFFILLNIALALLIGHWLGNSFYGFFVMAGFYVIVGLIVKIAGDRLFKIPIANSMIQKFLK
jgi:ABC-type uncharacterized transport system fused permease/ATPase subunit